MWPCANKRRKAAVKAIVAMREWEASSKAKLHVQRQEFARRYAEHLATLPPDRVQLLKANDGTGANNIELMRDCLRTAKSLAQELKGRPEIQAVCPGIESIRGGRALYLSVILNVGVNIQSCELHLPEFFSGYRVRTRVNRSEVPSS